MKNSGFWFLAAGAALWAVYTRRRRAAQAQAWDYLAASGQGTAFITGASAGIGAVFARALARQGYHLVIAARRADRLSELAQELEARYPIRVETLPVDLSDPAGIEQAAAAVAKIPDLTLLINNAGFGTGGSFAEVPVEPELKMIRLHVLASVRLIHAALPGMIRRGGGGIINVSSVAALVSMPGNATYGATKSYLNFFTGSLNAELAGTGVRVEALCPGFTLSEFHDVAEIDRSVVPALLWSRPEDVVREALQGLREGRELVIPGRLYHLLGLILRLPPVIPLARAVQRWRMDRMLRGKPAAALPQG